MSSDNASPDVEMLRGLARVDPARYGPALGLALYSACLEQRESPTISRHQLALLVEGIALHRKLLRANPASAPQLGLMLLWLGAAKFSLGAEAEAGKLVGEGLEVIRRMASGQPELYEPQLARALSMAGFTLGSAGDHRSAVSAAREAVGIWRQLADHRPGLYERDLVGALHSLCFAFQAAGRAEEMMAPAAESVLIVRVMSSDDPADARLLANGLDLRVALLMNQGRYQEALPSAEECVHCYAKARRDDTKSLNYASALAHLSMIHVQLGNTARAKEEVDRAWFQCMRRVRDTTDLVGLSATASEVATLLADHGMQRKSDQLIKYANLRLSGQVWGLGKLIDRFRRG